MHPALIEALSAARIADLHREAAHHRLAQSAAAERPGLVEHGVVLEGDCRPVTATGR